MKKIMRFIKHEISLNNKQQQHEKNSDNKEKQLQEKEEENIPLKINNFKKFSNFNNEKLYVYSNNEIHKIKHNHKIVKITSMRNNICFSNDRNEIFLVQIYNKNEILLKQLFCKEKLENNPPINIPIKFLIAGDFHLMIILENNLMYCHGCISDKTFIGPIINTLQLIDTSSSIFKDRNYQNKTEITHACCGAYFTIIVLNYKEIWLSGKINESDKENNLLSFTKIKFKGVVKNVSCGHNHLLILNNKGELFGYGYNGYNQLFKDDTSPIRNLTKIKLPFIDNKITFISEVFAIRLSHLSIVITNLNEIYLFGFLDTCFGIPFRKLSNKFKLNQSVFNKVKHLNEIKEPMVTDINETTMNENDKNYNYSNGELSIYGGYVSMFFVDNLNRNIWCGAVRNHQHFTNETNYLKAIDNELFSNEINERVLDIVSGFNIYGILIGTVNLFDSFVLNNLKRLVKMGYCEKQIEMEEKLLFDIDLKF